MYLGKDANTGEESEFETKERLKAMERKHHLMIWADNSTLLNHGHLPLTVNSVYDEALYFTNEERKAKGKGDIDVQAVVESVSGTFMLILLFFRTVINSLRFKVVEPSVLF